MLAIIRRRDEDRDARLKGHGGDFRGGRERRPYPAPCAATRAGARRPFPLSPPEQSARLPREVRQHRAVRVRHQPRPVDGGAELRSEEHTSELQSLMRISYAVFCLKKKNINNSEHHT